MKGREINYVLLSKVLLPVGVLICFAAYQLCVKKTWGDYQRYVSLNSLGNAAESLSISPAYSATREAAINKLYQRFLVDTVVWKNELWNQCATLSQQFNCSVEAFPEPRFMTAGQSMVGRQEVVFNGSFHNLLALQHALDTIKDIGLIGGLSYNRNQRALQTTLKIQLLALPDRGNE